MSLKSITEYEAEKNRLHQNQGSHYTGIECPACGRELQDAEPGVILMSNPPKKAVQCFGCGLQTIVTA